MEKKNQIPKYPLLRFPEFTDEWKEVKLGEVAVFFSGGTPSTYNKTFYKGDIPFIRSGEIHDSRTELAISKEAVEDSSAKIVFVGDILLALYGATSGDIAISKMRGAINQAILCIRPSSEIDRDFLFFTWEYRKEDIVRKYIQGGQGNLSAEIVKNIPLHLPSLAEQRKIAALLSLIDERIEVQNAIIKEQEVAKTLLSKELLTPEDDWTEYAVQDCLTYEQPAKYIVKHTDYSSDSTLTPVLTANKGFILGYTSEQGIYQKGACIIFDDFTLDCKYVPFAFKVKSSAIKILQARKGFDIRFMFEVIKSLSLSPFAHKRHYISEVEPIKILVPSFAKQEKIARLFAALDERLAVEIAYVELLKQQKTYLLRQMFI